MRHVHYGAGKLGLGFAGWLAKQLQCDFILANRGEPESGNLSQRNRLIQINKGYKIVYQQSGQEDISVASVLNFSDVLDGQTLAMIIADPSTKVVSISLKGNHRWISRSLLDGLRHRFNSTGARICIFAFENGISSEDLRRDFLQLATPDERGAMESCADFVPCVVDRICTGVRIDGETVVVDAESFGQLAIPSGGSAVFQDHPFAQTQIEAIKVEADIEWAKIKKLWMLNGPHLLLAMNARYEREFEFSSYIKANALLVEELFHEFSIGCLQYWCERKVVADGELSELDTDLDLCATTNHRRFEKIPDIVSRITSRFIEPTAKDPQALLKFFHDMKVKILEPALAYRRCEGVMPHRISLSLFRIMELLSDVRFE